jgi:hypothetical protein
VGSIESSDKSLEPTESPLRYVRKFLVDLLAEFVTITLSAGVTAAEVTSERHDMRILSEVLE